MQRKGISQEGLKGIACVSMLIDHIGATLVLMALRNGATAQQVDFYYTLRIIGRISFPIYCFLLVEGAHHTRNPKKYAMRLLVGILLSEIPFDLAFNGGAFVWNSNSVMITLLLGFGMIQCMMHLSSFWRIAVILPFYMLAEWLYTDYAGLGILVIAVLALTRGRKHEKLLRLAGLWLVLGTGTPDYLLGNLLIPLESFALLAVIPIFCYDGRKLTTNKKAQWAFYLFYPAHLLVLWMLGGLIYG